MNLAEFSSPNAVLKPFFKIHKLHKIGGKTNRLVTYFCKNNIARRDARSVL